MSKSLLPTFIVALSLLVGLAFGASPLLAQAGTSSKLDLNPDVATAAIPFSFLPPGARSLGMGGAFIAIADDATAAEANPAGLTILTRPEVSLHGRDSSFAVEVVDLNSQAVVDLVDNTRSAVLTAGFDVPAYDRPSTVQSLNGRANGLSFASYVHPFKHFVFSLYHQKSADFEGKTGFETFDEVFIDVFATEKDVDLLLDHIGAAVGIKLGDKVSLGLSVRRSRLKIRSLDSLRIDYFRDAEFIGFIENRDITEILGGQFDSIEDVQELPQQFKDPDFFMFDDFIVARDVLNDQDDDITFNVGLLFNPNGVFSAGLVYKSGGEYTLRGRREIFDCIDFDALGRTCDPEAIPPNLGTRTLQTLEVSYDIPDFFGVGLAWRPTDQLTIAADIDHITYSDLSSGDNPQLGIEEVDDETEFHLGLEYTWLLGGGHTPLSLRAGYFSDPDHDGFSRVDSDVSSYSVGAGIVIKQNVQVDLAGSFSDVRDEVTLSTVYRF